VSGQGGAAQMGIGKRPRELRAGQRRVLAGAEQRDGKQNARHRRPQERGEELVGVANLRHLFVAGAMEGGGGHDQASETTGVGTPWLPSGSTGVTPQWDLPVAGEAERVKVIGAVFGGPLPGSSKATGEARNGSVAIETR